MRTAILFLNFGEPEEATPEAVVPFLERIFHANRALEPLETEEARRARSRELAERRAPGLIEEYRAIGGSPLNAQAHAQARTLERELERRGRQVTVYSAFQFTAPLIPEVVARARDDGMDRIIGFPAYPLCGRSTNVAALDEVQEAIDTLGWEVEFDGLSGWHRHPGYLEMRADGIRKVADAEGLDLNGPGCRLVFSAHGTPMKYVEEGSYVPYVREYCGDVARILGVEAFELGYQNHSNRGVEWTQPDVEKVIEGVEASAVVVDAVSFMHEQSETLAELDGDLREAAEERGIAFHRVPVPHDDRRFATVMADLMDPFLTGRSDADLRYGPCRCRPGDRTVCLNAYARDEAAPLPAPLR